MIVLQDWVQQIPLMQQTVLLTVIRGPDGVAKHHPVKMLIRWYRRCVLLGSFEKAVLTNPLDPRGGSFTGPSVKVAPGTSWLEVGDGWPRFMEPLVNQYIDACEELPHHFQAHFRNGVQIIGYKHPVRTIRSFWLSVYLRIVDDAHMMPEPQVMMDKRLGDNEDDWRASMDRSLAAEGDAQS